MTGIDYGLVQDAIRFYGVRGFDYTEVPWVVSARAMNATVPVAAERITSDKCFVASGEQGFMQMIMDGILPQGAYCCATPCYRPWDAGRSDEHLSQFFKVELIHFHTHNPVEWDWWYKERYDRLKEAAFKFMSKSIPNVRIVETVDEPRQECTTLVSHDIVTSWGLELGSYGIRQHPAVGTWIYGTGLALPRFANAKRKAYTL